MAGVLSHRQAAYYFTDGSTNVSTPVEPGVWTHITATYDGASLKIYQDGVLAGETAAAGAIAAPNASKARWYIGADCGGEGEPQAFSAAKVAFAKLTHGTVATAEEVAANYRACAPSTIELPEPDAFGAPEVGAACVIPAAAATTANGSPIEAVPSVIDPEGNPVGLYLTSVPEGAAALAAAAARGTTLYSFVPTVDGNHTVTYRAGYSQASLTVSVAAAPIDPDPEPTPDPQPTPDPTPDPDPAPGNGAGGGTGSSGQGTGGSGTAPGSTGGSRLAKTGDGIEAGGALVGLMATAGAAICVARSFWKGEFSEEESR